jgi:ribonuclease HII
MLQSYLIKGKIEVGCDEAGRGCLAGPVVAAAVILPKNYKHKLLNDSKQTTEKDREILRKDIEKKAIAFAIGICSVVEIDTINILNASFKAMHRAIDLLPIIPEHILVDGNRFNSYHEIEHTCIIEGDAKFKSIAAASILAKTYRDDIMKMLHIEYPQYLWDKNKGYPTKAHRSAILEYGATIHHRMTFKLLPEDWNVNAQIELNIFE